MDSEIEVTETLDVKGVNCPMPVVETSQAIEGLAAGEVLEVVATDSGSMSDLAGWAEGYDGAELLDQVEGEADGQAVYRHYVERTA